ncbi:MAG: TonB-dependent receptor [Caulobacterales bacterium]
MKFNRFMTSVGAAAMAVGFVAGAAQAQESSGLADIIVSSQKRAENLQDVPIAVTALSSAQLAGANIEGQLALPKITPNLGFTNNSGFASPYLRGIGTQFANPGLEQSVSVYLDDIYMPRSSSGLFSFGDIERLEVLKGPQGTLYGRNATGGAIRVITKMPSKKFEGNANVTYGTDDRVALDGAINIPLGDAFSFRIAGRHDQNDGYVKNIAPNKTGGGPVLHTNDMNKNEDMVFAKLAYDNGGNFRALLSGDWAHKKDREGPTNRPLFFDGRQIGVALGGCVPTKFYEVCEDGPHFLNIRSHGAALRMDYDLEGVTVSSITGYRREYENNASDLDATGAYVQNVYGHPHTRQMTQELQAASNGSGPLKYVAGLFYLREMSGYDFFVSAPGGTEIRSGGKGSVTESYAAYAQIDYDFTDQWALSLGGRYTKEKKTLKESYGALQDLDDYEASPIPGAPIIRAPFGPCTPTNNFLCESPRDSIKFNKFTPKATLTFRPADGQMIYVSASRGFKSGGFNLPAFGLVSKPKPETLDDIEIGYKFENDTIRWNTAAFYYDYKDIQIAITNQATGGTDIKNASGAKVKGIESDLTWMASEQLELGVGGGYLDSKYKGFTPAQDYVACSDLASYAGVVDAASFGFANFACFGDGGVTSFGQNGLGLTLLDGQNFSGNPLVNAPKVTAYLRGTYTQPLMEGGGKLVFNAIVNYRSKAYFTPSKLFVDKERTMASGKISWFSDDEKYFLSLIGENLTGKKYFTINSPQNTGGWSEVGAPRQIYVQLGAKF